MKKVSRRQFFQIVTGSALSLSIDLNAESSNIAYDFQPNAWLSITPDNRILLKVASSEMGQGIMTSIATLIAEELDADWNQVEVSFAPADSVYNNPYFNRQATGGSTSIRAYWQKVREAGAVAREMLIQAAANYWQIDSQQCTTSNSYVYHKDGKSYLSYGELTIQASRLSVPDFFFLKEPEDFKLIGKSLPRLDSYDKTIGKAQFGLDILPSEDTLIAMVVRCPVFGGAIKHWQADQAKQVKGIKTIFEISQGIAIVGDHFWAVQKARDLLEVTWDTEEKSFLNQETIQEIFKENIDKGEIAAERGDIKALLASEEDILEATYQVPYLAHVCMEPVNCTVHITSDSCDIWVPTQAQGDTQSIAAKITGLARHQIKVHTTFLGGGFGRKGEVDFVAEAVEIARKFAVPVKLIWTREDDLQHDFYRPASFNILKASLDEKGLPKLWQHKIASPSILKRRFPKSVQNNIDATSVENAANLPYNIPHFQVSYRLIDINIPVGFWRSVGSSQNIYITEAFIDELAAKAGQDPYLYRLALLDESQSRLRQVLKVAAEKAHWQKDLPEGYFQGIAAGASFGSYVAQVATIKMQENKQFSVEKVVCVIDCGLVVNPDIVVAQMESGIVYGLSAALFEEITIEKGKVKQTNLADYRLLAMYEMPIIEVHIIPSNEFPGGVGEPGTPVIAPAVVNALFKAIQKPIRQLPIRLS